jgi:multidrug transporter EmrE-like cation transporter
MKRRPKNRFQKPSVGSKKQKCLLVISGFAFAIFLTYSFYISLRSHLEISNNYALYSSFAFSVLLLTVVFCFKSMRCFFFLLIPQVFNKRGRAAVVAYAVYLTVNGPTRNLVYNVHQLSDSLSCQQVLILNGN